MARPLLPGNRGNHRPRIVGAQDGPVVGTGARAPNGAPLTHPDAMTIPVSLDGERPQAAIGILPALHRKVGAVEDLATRRAENEADVVSPERVLAARRADAEHVHAPRRRSALHLHRANGADSFR